MNCCEFQLMALESLSQMTCSRRFQCLSMRCLEVTFRSEIWQTRKLILGSGQSGLLIRYRPSVNHYTARNVPDIPSLVSLCLYFVVTHETSSSIISVRAMWLERLRQDRVQGFKTLKIWRAASDGYHAKYVPSIWYQRSKSRRDTTSMNCRPEKHRTKQRNLSKPKIYEIRSKKLMQGPILWRISQEVWNNGYPNEHCHDRQQKDG